MQILNRLFRFLKKDLFSSKTRKKIFDLCITIILIILFFFPFVFIVLMLFVTQKRNIFFIQTRIGYLGKSFQLIKFKTMHEQKDMEGNLLSDEQRITKVGRLLRKTSLDELPQLLNILRGEMSLVGPRPLLPEYLNLYTVEQMRRHDALPGITGWAQVNGRNAIAWQEKLALDVWYVDNQSLKLDLWILWLTFIHILQKQKGNQYAEKFNGKN